jgi:hypothetical protein
MLFPSCFKSLGVTEISICRFCRKIREFTNDTRDLSHSTVNRKEELRRKSQTLLWYAGTYFQETATPLQVALRSLTGKSQSCHELHYTPMSDAVFVIPICNVESSRRKTRQYTPWTMLEFHTPQHKYGSFQGSQINIFSSSFEGWDANLFTDETSQWFPESGCRSTTRFCEIAS